MTDEEAITAGELALGLLEGDERAAALRLVIGDPVFAREVDRWRRRFAALNGQWVAAVPDAEVATRIDRATRPATTVAVAWRWLALAASAVAAVLLVTVVLRPSPAPAPPAHAQQALIAVVKPASGDPFGALIDGDRRLVRLSGKVAVPTGRQAELWTIGGDGAPHAAALLPLHAAPAVLRRDAAIREGMTLAISIEPIGGSPKPTPTGPVVATGSLTAI